MTHAPKDVFRMAEDVLGCKWMLHILDRLHANVMRPGALERAIPGITTKVLNERLRKLMRFGIIEKQAFAESPPRVEYRLTDFGRRLTAILKQLEDLQEEVAPAKPSRRRQASACAGKPR